jgi:hypothetical protein
MAFSDFKSIDQVQKIYQIRYEEANFIQAIDLQPSATFIQEIEFNQKNIDIFTSEAARCENIIYPILREIYKNFVSQYNLWSHKALSYDSELTGTPDYIFATKSQLGKTVLELPILLIVEAKQNNFSEGWGQCLAELIAAQKLSNDIIKPIFGIVTDGELWQFGKLETDIFTKQISSLTLASLEQIFGTIGYLLSVNVGSI